MTTLCDRYLSCKSPANLKASVPEQSYSCLVGGPRRGTVFWTGLRRAAEVLGIGRATIYQLLSRMKVEEPKIGTA
jgi:hypothetical protein